MRLLLRMKMQMRVTPQLVLAGELLRISAADLEHRIRQELEQNPALEQTDQDSARDRSWTKSARCHAGTGYESKFDLVHPLGEVLATFEDSLENLAIREPIIDQLITQAALLVDAKDLEAVTALLYSLDSNGYLRDSPEQLASDLNLDLADIKRLIPVLHELEPPGIGARDLRECLSIQYRYLETEGIHCALVRAILERYWDDLASQRWDRLNKKLGISQAELEDVLHFIAQNFNPHPLAMVNDGLGTSFALNNPDFIISRHNQNGNVVFSLEIPATEAFQLHLSKSFAGVIEKDSAGEQTSTQERDWMQMHVERARLFIRSLQRRWETLRQIGEYIIEFQKDFLEAGPSHLKPLTQARVAHALGCHESTISRAVKDKIVQLPNGRLVPIEIFFDLALPVKAALQQILENSRKSISDSEITKRLAQAGYIVARRTVAKYRAQINRGNSF